MKLKIEIEGQKTHLKFFLVYEENLLTLNNNVPGYHSLVRGPNKWLAERMFAAPLYIPDRLELTNILDDEDAFRAGKDSIYLNGFCCKFSHISEEGVISGRGKPPVITRATNCDMFAKKLKWPTTFPEYYQFKLFTDTEKVVVNEVYKMILVTFIIKYFREIYNIEDEIRERQIGGAK